MTESVNSTQAGTALSLGQQLKAAREALNLSNTDVAQKTNLKNHILNHLKMISLFYKMLPQLLCVAMCVIM